SCSHPPNSTWRLLTPVPREARRRRNPGTPSPAASPGCGRERVPSSRAGEVQPSKTTLGRECRPRTAPIAGDVIAVPALVARWAKGATSVKAVFGAAAFSLGVLLLAAAPGFAQSPL